MFVLKGFHPPWWFHKMPQIVDDNYFSYSVQALLLPMFLGCLIYTDAAYEDGSVLWNHVTHGVLAPFCFSPQDFAARRPKKNRPSGSLPMQNPTTQPFNKHITKQNTPNRYFSSQSDGRWQSVYSWMLALITSTRICRKRLFPRYQNWFGGEWL